ncbi:hypothetical protein NDU88_005204 [Pleurodeles waltl]|uniref:Uncharacterized protein n=1 Tax=Pleurodeles waltl TaxID=8319 RepID=A0AAV7QKB4_PLEWA|nr:hypothetical protein NDU88_005204 [Pleurodeles waltl]
MEQHITPAQLPQRQTHMGGPGEVWETLATAEELSHAELLPAIEGSRVVLDGKIKAVAVEVNLLQTDLRKVSDKVKVVERSIVDLEMEVSTLRKQMAQVTSPVGMLKARLEDSEGRSRRNNVRLLGFLESAKTPQRKVSWSNGLEMCCSLGGCPGCLWWSESTGLWLRSLHTS